MKKGSDIKCTPVIRNQASMEQSAARCQRKAKVKDPVYGCVGAISVLQGQVQQLQRELAEARADLARYTALEMRMHNSRMGDLVELWEDRCCDRLLLCYEPSIEYWIGLSS